PSAIVLGAVHPLSASSENRTRLLPSCPPGSIQVSRAWSPRLVRFGDVAPGPLGGSSAGVRAAVRDAERWHAAAQIDAHTRTQVVVLRCFRFSRFRTNDKRIRGRSLPHSVRRATPVSGGRRLDERRTSPGARSRCCRSAWT